MTIQLVDCLSLMTLVGTYSDDLAISFAIYFPIVGGHQGPVVVVLRHHCSQCDDIVVSRASLAKSHVSNDVNPGRSFMDVKPRVVQGPCPEGAGVHQPLQTWLLLITRSVFCS